MLRVHPGIAPSTPPGLASSEADLVGRAQQDPAAFAELYQRHVNKIYRYLLSRVGSVADAQDLTSQTFLTALESLSRYRGQGAFGAWLMGIARHKAMDHFRQNRVDLLDSEAVEAMADPDDPPARTVGQKLQVEQVVAKLRVLAPDRAEAIRLRLFAGLTAAEVAQVMERQESAVRMLIHRGLNDLQAQLGFTLEDIA